MHGAPPVLAWWGWAPDALLRGVRRSASVAKSADQTFAATDEGLKHCSQDDDRAPSMIVPATVPTIDPAPPNRLVPPITTAAIAVSS